ncbi:MAG: hypothetical protein WCL34_10710 [Methylococcaceae bacterium]
MNDNNDLSHHILPNSATMVGVCIMVVSIVKSLPPDAVNYFIDKALAVDCVLSFSRAVKIISPDVLRQFATIHNRQANLIEC